MSDRDRCAGQQLETILSKFTDGKNVLSTEDTQEENIVVGNGKQALLVDKMIRSVRF